MKYSHISHSPKVVLPENSCDCHHHIFDRRFPYTAEDKRNLPDATVSDYLSFKKWLGFSRHVVVQPSSYGTDNRCLIAALNAFGHCARGEAVVDTSITDAELETLHQAGVRGIRFNFGAGSVTTTDMILPLSLRVAEFGWHIQIHAPSEQLNMLMPVLKDISCRLVIDHYFRLPQPAPFQSSLWPHALELIDKGNCWVKLSALYHQSQRSDVNDMEAVITHFIKHASERVLWGSDWPHPNMISANKPMPDDALILSKIDVWAENPALRKKLFVTNPAELYGFNEVNPI